MKRLLVSFLCLALIAFGVVSAQESDAETLKLHLKSGETLEGKLVKSDEDGVKLDIGDSVELFIRWSYTRGDRHYELRKKATDFEKLDSVLKLADFCHDFAMDEKEVYILATALRLDPENQEVRSRLAELPKVEGVDIPGVDDDEPEPEVEKPEPIPEDEPDDTPPPPVRGTFTVFIDMQTDNDAAEAWLEEQLEEMKYKVGGKRDHEIRLEIEIELKLIANPKFYGEELYAIYDGELTWKLFKKGERDPFAQSGNNAKGVRRDTRAEALTRCRTDLLETAFEELYSEMEKQR